ncbi:MAG: hypothetical protein ABI728_14000 [Betaproteobacteria bacterium]
MVCPLLLRYYFGFALLVTPVLAATDQQEKTKACNAAAEKKD